MFDFKIWSIVIFHMNFQSTINRFLVADYFLSNYEIMKKIQIKIL